jgi:hypothetical protein
VRGDGSIAVRFEPSEQAVSYRVRCEPVGGTAARTIEVDAAQVDQAIITGVENSQAYQLSIAAVGEGGVSQYSAPVTVAKAPS